MSPASPFLMRRMPSVLLALLLLGCVACRDEAPEEERIGEERYVPPPPSAVAEEPIPFHDVTEESGLAFRHETGAFLLDDGTHSRWLPECMGPGVVLFDADGDGRLDLYVPNGHPLEPGAGPTDGPGGLFALNRGGMRFEDRTREAGLDIRLYGMGGTAADLDGDGAPELLVTTLGGPRLFHNRRDETGVHFREITDAAGLDTPSWKDAQGHEGEDWAVSAAFFDADRDGDLDLFVVNYVRWCPENDVFESLDGQHKSYAIPKRYEGHTCRLFLQEGTEGTLRFREATEAAGLLTTKAKGMGLALWDVNEDGILDVFVANDSQPNFLYVSEGPARFVDRAQEANVDYDQDGRVRAGMGIAAEEYARDGALGVPIGNFSNEPVSLYREESAMLFRDVGQAAGVAASTHPPLTFGLVWTDADLDGLPDLVLGNGHLEPDVQRVSASIPYRQRPMLVRQVRPGVFRDATEAAGPGFEQELVARGLAAGDLDGDGDEDLVISNNGGGIVILRNDQATGHRSLTIQLKGRGANQEAIGTRIDLEFSDGTSRRLFARHGGSYASQSALLPIVGLGESLEVEAAAVTWPDGRTTQVQESQLASSRWALEWPE